MPGGRPLKEGAVERIVTEARLDAVLYAGDDVADQRAFEALDRLAAGGLTTLKVAVHGPETPTATRAMRPTSSSTAPPGWWRCSAGSSRSRRDPMSSDADVGVRR